MSDVVAELRLRLTEGVSHPQGASIPWSKQDGLDILALVETHEREITRLRAELASAVAAERERCARVAEEYPTNDYAIGMAMKGTAAAIRKDG